MLMVLPLSSTSSFTFFIVELRLRSSERRAEEDRWPAIRWMLHGWMILILVLTLCSPHAIKPQCCHRRSSSASSFRRDFFRRSFPSRACCRCRANHAISRCISCYVAWARVKTDVTAIMGCHGGGAPSLHTPLTRDRDFSPLSSRSQPRPSFSALSPCL